MTVSSSINRVSYAGNGTTVLFPVNYYFLQDTHLQVVLITAAGVETIQTLTTDYTVTGAGNEAGGSITMLVAPPSGTTLVIQREVPATQETDYLANDPFPAESHERALDKLTMLVQQNNRKSDRAILFPISDVNAELNNVLPNAFDRASTFLTFDGNGEVTVTDIASATNQQYTITRQNFTGTGSQILFTLSSVPASNGAGVTIYIDGVYQNRSSYTIYGTSLVFSEAPPLNASVEYLAYDIADIGSTTATATSQSNTNYAGNSVQDALDDIIDNSTGTGSFVRTTSPQSLTAAGAVDLTSFVTFVDSTAGVMAITLADGFAGQVKTLVMVADNGDATLTPANFGNGSTITFTDAGDSCALVFNGTDWWVVSNNGCTVA